MFLTFILIDNVKVFFIPCDNTANKCKKVFCFDKNNAKYSHITNINLMLSIFHSINYLEAGTDEAGRGCLAGPVTCAAVLLQQTSADEKENGNDGFLDQLNDSKKLSAKKRVLLRPIIEQKALDYAVIHIDPATIDSINILNASILGMQKAVLKLAPTPKHIIVDGNRFNSGLHLDDPKVVGFYKISELDNFETKSIDILPIPYTTIIKGDSKYMSIAAASILAKTYRDDYMLKIHEEYPMYNWKQNKGYPTKEHREAILKYGRCKYHRMTFSFEDKIKKVKN